MNTHTINLIGDVLGYAIYSIGGAAVLAGLVAAAFMWRNARRKLPR